MINRIYFYYAIIFAVLAVPGIASAQATAFSYQGKLADTGVIANASYDFEFRLFDVASGGAALGTQTKLAVPVANGVFKVLLDFGANIKVADRFLELGVRPAGGTKAFTILAPREHLTSAPPRPPVPGSGTGAVPQIEQQRILIQNLQTQVTRLEQKIDELKAIVCKLKPGSCKETK